MNESIKQALLDWNPWLTGIFPEQLLGYGRNYNLEDYLQVPEVKIVEGARRVGKSTLLYQVIHTVYMTNKNILYVNFEDEVLKKFSLSEIIYTYLELAPIEYLFVDEIQNCHDWVQFVRKMYDRKEFKQIWLSGSNSSLIKQEYATLLTGRNLAITINPLSFSEFLHFKSFAVPSLPIPQKMQSQLYALFNEYIEYGAFPAVVNREVLKKELLIAYFEDFIYKDIASRYDVNAAKIKELAIYLATNSAKNFSYRSIASTLNCHPNTIIDYLSYLKEVFLFDELYKFDYSLKKQFSNDKKAYCLDTGMAAAVSFRFSSDKGRILETIVYRELRQRKQTIYFHKQHYECDFLVKSELEISQAIQVCYSLADAETKAREINGLLEAMQCYNLHEGLILTDDEASEEKITTESGRKVIIKIVPIWRWLLGFVDY
jgi:predicted AAA+ superfamily ATPase